MYVQKKDVFYNAVSFRVSFINVLNHFLIFRNTESLYLTSIIHIEKGGKSKEVLLFPLPIIYHKKFQGFITNKLLVSSFYRYKHKWTTTLVQWERKTQT